jgi:hypothetical protein
MEMNNDTLQSNAETDALISWQALELYREAWIGGTGVARNDPGSIRSTLICPASNDRRRCQPAFSARKPAQLHPWCRSCARGGPGDRGDSRVAAIQAQSCTVGGGLVPSRGNTPDAVAEGNCGDSIHESNSD